MNKRIFSIIGWIGTAAVLAAVAIRFFLPERDQYATYLAEAGLACMVLYIASLWREIGSFFRGRQARYGTLTAASVFIVLGILIAVNYIGKRQNKRWDLTAAKQFSLSDQSRNVVSKLDAPLNVTVFARETEFQTFRDRLDEYTYTSKQVKTEYIDPDKKPAIAQQSGIQQYGTIVFNYKDRTEKVTGDSEQDITNGIIKVVSGEQRKVYFTIGHGEKDTSSQERDGYGNVADAVGKENYALEQVALAQTGSVPADATILVVAGPQTDFLPKEIEAIKAFLAKGGKVLMMIDPPQRPDDPLANLTALAHEWGIDLGNNIVVDVSGVGQLFGASEAVPVAVSYPAHPITERFRGVMTAYPLARSVEVVAGGVGGHTAQAIVETSAQSWGETDVKALSAGTSVKMDEGKDKPGPITLGAAVSAQVDDATKSADASAPKAETRVVVFGDSDFVSNSARGISGNRDLFMNTLGWLSQQENLISIRPKEADSRPLDPMPASTQALVMYGGWLGMPLLVFGIGIYSWLRRR